MKRKLVLVAEDNSEDAFLLNRCFIKAGIGVQLCFVRDGEDAVDYLEGKKGFADRTEHPITHLVLLDLKMPKLNGFEVLEWIRAQPELKRLLIIVLTSSGERKDVNQAYDLGANSYVVKPSSLKQMGDVVEKLHSYWLEINQVPDCGGKC
jgi:CheY-like chemotaxis protein